MNEMIKCCIEAADAASFKWLSESGHKYLMYDSVPHDVPVRAVIEAMREPQGRFRNILDSYVLQNGGSLLEIWDEVIDAALEDETTKK